MNNATGTQFETRGAANGRFLNVIDIREGSSKGIDAAVEACGGLIDQLICSRLDRYDVLLEQPEKAEQGEKNDIESLLRQRAETIAGYLEERLDFGPHVIGSNRYFVIHDYHKTTYPQTWFLYCDGDNYSFRDVRGLCGDEDMKRATTEHHIQLIEDMAKEIASSGQAK